MTYNKKNMLNNQFQGDTPSIKKTQNNYNHPNTYYKASQSHLDKINMLNTNSPNFNASKRDIYFINKAIEASAKSNMMMKHGCVVTLNNKLIADGYNSYRTQFGDKFINKSCSCHAEMHALRKALKLKTKGRVIKYREKVCKYEQKPS